MVFVSVWVAEPVVRPGERLFLCRVEGENGRGAVRWDGKSGGFDAIPKTDN